MLPPIPSPWTTAALLALPPTAGGSSLLSQFGALGVLTVLFAESGLLVIGFFLPGDTLLFPAGVLCSAAPGERPGLVLWQVLLCAALGSSAGAQFAFWTGRRGGRSLLAHSRNRHLPATLARTEDLILRFGIRKAIVLGRFVPMARTVLSPLTGLLDVPVRTFTLWQIIGSLAWTQSLVLAGYLLGNSFPNADHYLLPLVAAIVALSLLPLLTERLRRRRA